MKQRMQQLWAVIVGMEVITALIYYGIGIYQHLGEMAQHWH